MQNFFFSLLACAYSVEYFKAATRIVQNLFRTAELQQLRSIFSR